MSDVAVVIPYYQRQPGLLARTVKAAVSQRDVPTPMVIVVDDGSPVPVETELLGLPEPARDRVIVLKQANNGPGPARNLGLEAVPEKARWVAFLDSDDVWTECHLARGIKALEQGYDFFFADLYREGDRGSHFDLCGFDISEHRRINEDSLFEFSGNFFTRCLTRSPALTSSVVFRKSVLGGLRFPNGWETPGEDLLFWLDAARATSRITFSSCVEVYNGHGNITVTPSWKSNHELKNLYCYRVYCSRILEKFQLTPEQSAIHSSMVQENQDAFARSVLGIIRSGSVPDLSVTSSYFWRNPGIAFHTLKLFFEEVARRAIHYLRHQT